MTWMDTMAGLLVCDVSVEIVRALKERPDARGRSAKAEHREIGAAALLGPRKRSFADVRASMPDVGRMRISNACNPSHARGRSLNQAHQTTHNQREIG
jgi:plasmid stability protein